MAFIFNPNPSEGDKQTNPDTGVEYIYSGGAWRALGPKIEDEFDTLDARYIKLEGTSRTTGTWRLKGDNETGDGEATFQSIGGGYQKLYHIQTPDDDNTGWVANVEYVQSHVDEKIAAIPDVDLDGYATEQYVNDAIDAIPSVNLDGYATEQYVDDAIADADLNQYLKKSGGTLTGSLQINRGGKPSAQWKITPNSGDNYATNIYSLGNGEMRFRTSHTQSEENHIGSHIVLDPKDGAPETKIYHLVTPTREDHAANKQYVDNAIANAGSSDSAPASLCWEWRNHDTLSDPGEGKVAWYSASSFFRLNLKTANGVFLGKNVLSRKDVSFNQHLTGGIWRLVGGDWQMIQLFQIQRMQWNHNDCVWLYRNNSILGSNNFTAGEKYYFTVGGFF